MDLYTKAVLTIIALSLTVIAGKQLTTTDAHATQDEIIKVDIVKVNGYPVHGAGMPVEVIQDWSTH